MHLSSEAGEGLHVEGRVATGRGVFVLVCTSDCYSFLNFAAVPDVCTGGCARHHGHSFTCCWRLSRVVDLAFH